MRRIDAHCRTCGEADPSRFYGTMKSTCKRCHVAQVAARIEANPERTELYRLRSYANQLVQVYARRQEQPVVRRRRPINPDAPSRQPEYYAEWKRAHPESQRASSRKWRAANRDRRRAYDAERYKNNRDAMIAANARWHRENPGRVNARHATRWHNQRGNGGTHTLTEWREKVALFAGCCAYCGEAKPLARDHVLPVSRGGTSDIANIVPACKSCNSAKKDRTAAEFLAIREVA